MYADVSGRRTQEGGIVGLYKSQHNDKYCNRKVINPVTTLNTILVRGFSGPRYKLLIKLVASRKFVSRVTSNFFDNFLEAFK